MIYRWFESGAPNKYMLVDLTVSSTRFHVKVIDVGKSSGGYLGMLGRKFSFALPIITQHFCAHEDPNGILKELLCK